MVELIWDGKYDEHGKRSTPLRVALPFQTVETVNESAQERQMMLDMFSTGRDPEWRNRLIWGDKKYVLPSLLPEFAGKVNLIYIDPPFATGADFSFKSEEGDEVFEKEPSVIEQKAYRDTWGRGLDSYMEWFGETITFLYELLAEDGSIYVHCDWHVGHYIKLILDEVFGLDNFRNQIIWHFPGREMHISNKFNAKHEMIFFYGKSERSKIRMENVAIPYDRAERIKTLRRKVHTDPDGREWVWETRGQASGQEPYKRYIDEIISKGKPLNDVWADIQFLRGNHPERVSYSTQKPEALIERIIKASSDDDSLILDCFCGSGTTPAVAEKLNRRWIACDLGRFAIHTARKRLLGIPDVKPFVVQNLGKYERQVWQQAKFGEQAKAMVNAYRRFILDLYHAQPVSSYMWLHGKKGGRMVHVGSVDSPVALGDIQQIAIEFRKAIGTGKNAPKVAGVDVLGWDFALDMNETAQQIAAEAGLDVRFLRIPREVLERKAVEQRDIFFYELAALSVDCYVEKQTVYVELIDFMVPPDDVPQDVIEAVQNWLEWIDYWAVDFNYREDTFHNEWQSYRTRQNRTLQLNVSHPYDDPGTYTILVKVIDILGNDTTKAIEIEVN